MSNYEREILKGFFVLEGLEGSGKTTQLQHLTDRACKEGLRFRADREPTNLTVGQRARHSTLVHEQTKEYFTKETTLTNLQQSIIPLKELALFFAQDRQEHIEGKGGVRDFLAEGGSLLCDRYLFSSLAYQSQHLPFEEILALNAHFPLPEAVFFFEIDLETAQKRLKERHERASLFDDISFQNKVLTSYKKAFETFPEIEIINLNACDPITSLTDQIWNRICR